MVEIRNYNVKGDGVSNDTAAVQAALDSGEVVHFTAGTYLCGSLYLRSNGGILLDEGATLLAIPGREHYNAADFSPRNRVFLREHTYGQHFIIAEDCENISITGKGTISGNYKSVFDTSRTVDKWRTIYDYPEWRMSQMIFLAGCKNVLIRDVSLRDSQYWNCFLLDCEDVLISRVNIRADRMVNNADGVDIDCCRNVKIEECDIDTGDDCIALRANEAHALRVAPCDGIEVKNCLLRSPACAVRFGVGNGTLRNCTMKNLKMYECAVGIGLCPSYTPGKCVNIEDILVEDVTFEGKRAFQMLAYWGGVMEPDDPEIKPVQNITIRNFTGQCSGESLITAPEKQGLFRNFRFENVTLTMCADPIRISERRWPYKECGVLNVYRMPELDVSSMHLIPEGGNPEVLFRP